MKLIKTTGCTAYSFTANGEDLNKLTRSEKKAIIEAIVETQEPDEMLDLLVDSLADFEFSDYVCGTCGDIITTETL